MAHWLASLSFKRTFCLVGKVFLLRHEGLGRAICPCGGPCCEPELPGTTREELVCPNPSILMHLCPSLPGRPRPALARQAPSGRDEVNVNHTGPQLEHSTGL